MVELIMNRELLKAGGKRRFMGWMSRDVRNWEDSWEILRQRYKLESDSSGFFDKLCEKLNSSDTGHGE